MFDGLYNGKDQTQLPANFHCHPAYNIMNEKFNFNYCSEKSVSTKFDLTRVGYTEPVGNPVVEVISRYSRDVNCLVEGQ